MRLVFSFLLFFLTCPLFAVINFQFGGWNEVLKKAKLEDKLIFVELTNSPNSEADEAAQESDLLARFYKNDYTTIRIDQNHPDFAFISKKYAINSYPSYLYLNSSGNLLVPIQTLSNKDAFLVNGRLGIEQKKDRYPLAQMDLDYKKKQMDKNQLYEYIVERTKLGYDNSSLIDEYVGQVPFDVLKISALKLFLLSNTVNVNGLFFNLIEKNKNKVIDNLNLNEYSFSMIVKKCINHTFEEICKNKDENKLNELLSRKDLLSDKSEILKSEYFTIFYYKTHQPLKLAKVAPVYAHTLIENTNNPSSNSNPEYSEKLCQAARYIVESLSNKSMLDNALHWVNVANEMTVSFKNYETKAYVLYKLGKRNEAISSMEKAFSMVPKNSNQITSITSDLIKMKRGERIF